jgi:hypothetical protein
VKGKGWNPEVGAPGRNPNTGKPSLSNSEPGSACCRRFAAIDILIRANMPSDPHRVAIVLLMLSLLCACSHPPADNASNSANTQKLPFDREPRSTGISPSQSLIPSTTKLPEGTPIPIRLQSPLSSASSHAGDTFSATIDEPVVIDGQTVVARGTSATGRVLEAKPAASSRASSSSSSNEDALEPGYLRIVLVSVNIGRRPVMIETSSIFAKGGSREERTSAAGAASGSGREDKSRDKDVVFSIDRRLNFRLAQSVDLQ